MACTKAKLQIKGILRPHGAHNVSQFLPQILRSKVRNVTIIFDYFMMPQIYDVSRFFPQILRSKVRNVTISHDYFRCFTMGVGRVLSISCIRIPVNETT